MRKITKNTFGLFSLGVLGISYATGAAAELPQSFSADAPIAIDGASGTPSAASTDAAPTESSSSSSTASPSASASKSASSTSGNIAPSATPKATKSASATGSGSTSGNGTAASTPPAPSVPPAPAPSATATQPATTTVTKTGASIKYKYGNVQLSVTKVNGKITNVTVVQGTATDGRAKTFPTLVTAAISAQGASFGNISNATFTTDAFKEALTSALGMF